MNKFSIFAGALAMASISFSSCNNELNDIKDTKTPKTVISRSTSDITTEKIDFLYKGIHYQANSTVVNDSIISIDNVDVESLLLELDQKNDLITFSYPDGTYEYFDDKNDFNANKERVFALSIEKEKDVQPLISPRGRIDLPNYNYVANLFLHDGKRLRDSILSLFFRSYIFARYKNESLWI